ncbi:transcription termination factor Rho [Terrabacter sp. NPDC080008]|uniref:transcription termination factor Rho n=1 Tax=Terrabacter sp. NPDC080008 TaxID=3155176 RepID=UPI00344E369D
MSETTTRPVSGLSAMKLDELKGVASSMGITGTTKMRKSDLVEAIKARQSGGSSAPAASGQPTPAASSEAPAATSAATSAEAAPAATEGAPARTRGSRRVSRPAGSAAVSDASDAAAAAPQSQADSAARPETAAQVGADETSGAPARERAVRGERRDRNDRGDRSDRAERAERAVRETLEPREDRQHGDRGDRQQGDRQQNDRQQNDRQQNDRGDRQQNDRGERQQNDRGERQQNDRGERQQNDRGERQQNDRGERQQNDRGDRQQNDRGDRQPRQDRQDRQDRQHDRHQDESADHNRGQQSGYDDDERGSRRSRNRQRSRDRKRGRGRDGGQEWADTDLQIGDDDVLVPVGGILDVLDNYAFVRTSGYLAGSSDVYVPLGMVKKHGLRKGDAVTGAVKALREGEQPSGNVGRQKFNALVRLDTVNGQSPDEAAKRVEFGKLTPLYPQQRLRLETEPHVLTTRIIDLVAPIGKGQRGLIVAPAKAGKTMIMQTIANAITTNNPECHLMVVLVDERPEEVTDMQRAVKGEVISSTFDRPAEDHTTVAELAIERAKRLVELGHDVVVLLDSITKLGRAYNLAAPASGRILSGGVDSAALYPPKKFFGAARNIENGGSLTILATALVETGSKMDEVIFEEFKGTGNMELRLSRDLANRRIFPAVDINSSGTRREEILLASEELKIMWKLRRVLGGLDAQQAIELLIDRLKKTRTNYEFLTQVQHTSGSRLDDDA